MGPWGSIWGFTAPESPGPTLESRVQGLTLRIFQNGKIINVFLDKYNITFLTVKKNRSQTIILINVQRLN